MSKEKEIMTEGFYTDGYYAFLYKIFKYFAYHTIHINMDMLLLEPYFYNYTENINSYITFLMLFIDIK